MGDTLETLEHCDAALRHHPHPRRLPPGPHGSHRPRLGGGRLPPGRGAPGADGPVRSPLADVADLLWSLHLAATGAGAERDPAERRPGPPGLDWEARNRRAFLSGYLATPGISGLVGPDRNLVLRLVSFLELARSVPRVGPAPKGAAGQTARAETLNVSAASSGETTLMATPVPSSKPAVVVALGQTCACQWNGSPTR